MTWVKRIGGVAVAAALLLIARWLFVADAPPIP